MVKKTKQRDYVEVQTKLAASTDVRGYPIVGFTYWREEISMQSARHYQQEPDHGLPLVQLKERRRELVLAHRGQSNPPTAHELMEIAAIQHAISAFEDLIVDLDAATDTQSPNSKIFLVATC